jgi:hypothetical protein
MTSRSLFIAYLVVVLGGLTWCIVVGLMGR